MVAFSVRASVTRCVIVCLGCGISVGCDALAVKFETDGNKSSAGQGCVFHGDQRQIAWLHIPKTGSSFGNVIAHYLRPDLPKDALVPDCRVEKCEHTDNPSEGNIEFQHRYKTNRWFRDCLWLKDGHGPDNFDWFEHHQLHKNFWPQWEGHFVGMFRDPAQRAISSWNDFADMVRPALGYMPSKAQWARHIEGTATKMLAGQEFPIEVVFSRGEPSSIVPDVDLAISRLDGFRFVGLLDHWQLSICLFHKITASDCHPFEGANSRRNGHRAIDGVWDTAELDGYVDPYDTKVYQAVTARFWRDVKKHRLTTKSCMRRCRWFDPESLGLD